MATAPPSAPAAQRTNTAMRSDAQRSSNPRGSRWPLPSLVQTITDIENDFKPPTMALQEKWRFIPIAGAAAPALCSGAAPPACTLCTLRLLAAQGAFRFPLAKLARHCAHSLFSARFPMQSCLES